MAWRAAQGPLTHIMQHLTYADHRALFNCLGVLYAHHDTDRFKEQVLLALAEVLPSDHVVFFEMNPLRQAWAYTALPADVNIAATPEIRDMFFRDHPVVRYIAQTGCQSALKISDFLSQAQWRETGLYREVFRGHGVEFNLGCPFSGPDPEIIASATFSRTRRDFSERDRLKLNLLRPHLSRAYANAALVDGLRGEASLANEALEASGQGLITVAADGAVLLCTAVARQQLGRYFGNAAGRADLVPAQVRSWMRGRDLPGMKNGAVPSPQRAFVIEANGKRLSIHLLSAPTTGHRILLLEEHHARPSEEPLQRLLGLTARRAEVLLWVTQGKTSPDIAVILGLSVSTVNKHLEHIFAQLGVETRTAAALCATEALNQNPPPFGIARAS